MTPGYEWEYRKLGDFSCNVLPESQIKSFVTEWLKSEWEIDPPGMAHNPSPILIRWQEYCPSPAT